MANGNSSFGKRRDAGAMRAQMPSEHPSQNGKGRVSIAAVLAGNAASIAAAIVLIAIIAIGAVLTGTTKQAHASNDVIAITILIAASLTAAYVGAFRAGRSPFLHGFLSALLLIAVTIVSTVSFKDLRDLLVNLAQAAAILGAALVGSAMARAQSQAGLVIPWWRVGRGALAVLVGFVVSAATIAISFRLGFTASITLPALALVFGIGAAAVIAPRGDSKLVASIYFGLIILAVTAIMIDAELTHTVKAHHWIMFVEIGLAWFWTRKIWRLPQGA